VAAKHCGASTPVDRGACDSFCAVVQGLPVQEAAEHGVIHLIERLRDPYESPPVLGILTPGSCGEVFVRLESQIREIYSAYQAESGDVSGWNQWNPRVPAEWLRLDKEQQAQQLKPIIASHLSEQGLTSEDLWISDIERGIRVVISFGEGVPLAEKPKLLMQVERRLREATGKRIEVYAHEMTDKNVLRRL
jgi:hypothetical protein